MLVRISGIWVESGEEGEVETVDLSPIIGAAIKGDDSRPVDGLNPNICAGSATTTPMVFFVGSNKSDQTAH